MPELPIELPRIKLPKKGSPGWTAKIKAMCDRRCESKGHHSCYEIKCFRVQGPCKPCIKAFHGPSKIPMKGEP